MKKSTRFFTNLQLTRSALFIALMAIAANLTAFITIGSVPLTFQTAIAIFAGILLGKKAGFFAMIGYVLIGLVGAPVFAGFQGGLQSITSPTFGFILSFVAVAFVVGLIYEKIEKHSFTTYLFIAYVGLFINYSLGIIHLFFYMMYIVEASQVNLVTITVSMLPFMLKDLVLVTLMASILPRIKKALSLSSYR